jgi:ribosomal protein S18 acetylase RimI-like enzyme
MKSKEIKALRKELTNLNKLTVCRSWLSRTLGSNVWEKTIEVTNNEKTVVTFTPTYYPSSLNMAPSTFQQCLDVFQNNMSTLYQDSSWGLDMKEKEEELKHDHARFLLVFATTTTASTATTTTPIKTNILSSSIVAAFCHFRFEFDHEEHPTCIVLYVYELQVSTQYQGKGVGKHLMEIIHDIGQQQHPNLVSKIVLTVFKNNVGAMKFYKQTLGYVVDETDPSHFGHDTEDYEILSLSLGEKV